MATERTAAVLRSAWVKPAAATVTALAVVLAYHIAGNLHQHGIVASSVQRELRTQGLANVEVVLTVVPESYNTTFLQKYGSLAGIQGKTAYLLGVTASGVDHIAAQYWVAAVRPHAL